jgi:hypothetical protein
MQFWVIDDENTKAVMITSLPYRGRMWDEFRPWFQSANSDMVHAPLVAVMEEMVRQLDQPLLRDGCHAAAGHVREAIAAIRKADEEMRDDATQHS